MRRLRWSRVPDRSSRRRPRAARWWVATDLSEGALAGLYAGDRQVEAAFTAQTAEAVAYGGISLVHGGGEGLQTVTGSLRVQISSFALADGLGDAAFGLLGGDAIGGGFESLRLEVFTGTADFVTLFDREFGGEAQAERFFDDHVLDFGNLSANSEFGSIYLTIRVTAVLADEGDGFTTDLLFADLGGTGGGGDDPVGPFFAAPAPLLPTADLMLV